ncbi:MAG: cytochrome c3 family protein [Syntrophales bacterium]
MNKRYLSLASIMTLCLLLLLISGCGSSGNKEGDTVAVTAVGDRLCIQCHSAVTDPLTGQTIMAQYERSSPHKDSAHANNGNGCEACHGNASQHQGVGPITYPNPYASDGARCADCHKGNYAGNFSTKFADSLHKNMAIETSASCRRCHTHEGAVLANATGWTGSKEVIDNPVYQGPANKEFAGFECSTCHEHGGGLRAVTARDSYSVGGAAAVGTGSIVSWNPSKSNQLNDQYNLCTSCHNLKTYAGAKVMASGSAASGTVKVGHHETSWYRVIATTHNNNADNTVGGISGYVIRIPKTAEDAYALTTNPNARPCFDCHAHEAKTNTQYSNPADVAKYDEAKSTIYTDWAKSPHAGGLLEAKVAAAGSAPATAAQVDTVMNASVGEATAAAWFHYDWSNGTNTSANRQDCQQCHTATGASNYLKNPAKYDKTKNDFQHLAGWTNVPSHTGTPGTFASKQREVLYCWGCHSSAGVGTRRTPGAITANYNFQGAKAQFPDVGDSNICISCHIGRDSGESITAKADSTFNNLSFVNSHYLAVGGLMYVKAGFTAFIDPNTPIGTSTYGKSLTSDADGGALTSTHRKLGTTAMNGDKHNPAVFTPGNFDSNGPCVTCHMQATGQPTRSTSHTWEINWNAFDEVCIKCHDEEGGVPLTEANFKELFIDEQAIPFQDALAVALNQLLSKYNISYNQAAYPYFYDLNIGPTSAVKDWTRGGALTAADAKKLMGACFNINILKREPAAYVHARTYARRLLYDTIDFLDDKTINRSVTATAVAYDPVKYVKGALATSPETTEDFKYLAGYNRTTGAWSTPERP